MSKLHFTQNQKPVEVEKLVMSKHSFDGTFNSFSGISGEYWVSIIPSLNTSGYGLTEQESYDDLNFNVEIFLKYLLKLPDARRQVELRKMGWKKNRYFKRKFSNEHADNKGVIENFDDPTSVKVSRLQSA